MCLLSLEFTLKQIYASNVYLCLPTPIASPNMIYIYIYILLFFFIVIFDRCLIIWALFFLEVSENESRCVTRQAWFLF